MATVFRARDRRHSRDVAIKVLSPELSHAVPRDRFRLEIEISAGLQHPHIVTVFDSGASGDCLYYVMPHVAGESLRDRLRHSGQLPVPEALRIARDVGSALAHAHGKGVVHRDVKPENILLSSGEAMLADFGIAKARAETGASEWTGTGVAIGTPEYMSPEQGAGNRDVGPPSDVYSLGCVLFEMLAGEPPFTGPTSQAIIARHLHERVPSLLVVRPNVPKPIVRLVERSLAKVAADRFPTAAEFLEALEAASVERRGPGARTLVAAGSVIVLVGVTAWLALRPRAPTLDRQTIAIFPLEERGLPPTLEGAGTDVALMIAAALERAEPLRALDVHDWLTEAQRDDPALLTARQRRAIALARGAGTYITGVVQGHRDSTTVILRLADVASDAIMDQQSVGAPRGEPLHHLGIDAVKRLLPSLIDPGRIIDLTPLRDRKASAIALFVQGERQYRLSHFQSALSFYQRALGEDSALAIAAVKGAQAAGWNKDQAAARQLVGIALARATLLPPRYAAFAKGWDAYLAGRADSAIAWLERALRTAPTWAEGLMALGEVYYHLLPLVPRPDSLAEAAFDASLASDTGFTPPLFHLAEIAIRNGDLARGRSLLGRFLAAQPSMQLADQLQLMLACVEAGRRGFDWSDAAGTEPRAVLLAAKALMGGGQNLACANRAYRSLLASDSLTYHWGALLGLNSVLVATRQPEELIALVDSTVHAGTLRQAMTLYVVDAIAGLPVEPQAREVQAFGEKTWGPSYAGLGATPNLSWLQWLFGAWSAHTRRAESLGRLQAALAVESRNGTSSTIALYADALAADMALLRGDTTAAIEGYLALSPTAEADSLDWSLGLSLAAERLQLARLLFARGRYADAHDVATIFDHQGPVLYPAFLPASLELRYQAALARGWSEAAARYRQRLVDLGRSDLLGTGH
jgi:tetratricopeptide (TPR) repeat protein